MSKHVPKRLFEINPLTKQGYARVFVPYVTIPNVTIPNVTIPNVTIPNVTIPNVTIPNVTILKLANIYTNPKCNPKRH
jgi:hypothetical protein